MTNNEIYNILPIEQYMSFLIKDFLKISIKSAIGVSQPYIVSKDLH